MDEPERGVSPYLRNPVPFFNPTTTAASSSDGSEVPPSVGNEPVETPSFGPDQVAKIRTMVAELLVFGFHGTSLNDHARRLISMGAGGVILFNRNFRDPEQVARLCHSLKALARPRALLVMVDQEGGDVQRLGPPFTRLPHARVVGDAGDPAAAAAVASVAAAELRAVNVDMNLAPVLDVDTHDGNAVIGRRAFATTPEKVADFGFAFIRSLQREGIAACAKHYPGHGGTLLDSHLHLPLLPHSLTQLMATELPPFQRAIQADVAAVMVAHIQVPCFTPPSPPWPSSSSTSPSPPPPNPNPNPNPKPATMCKDAISYLRDVLLFEGVILSDCMELGAIVKEFPVEEAAVRAVVAGVDMVLVSHTMSRQIGVVGALAHCVLEGRIPYNRVVDAVSRVATLKAMYVRNVGREEDGDGDVWFWESELAKIGCKEHQDVVASVIHQARVVGGRGARAKRGWGLKFW